MFYKGRMKVLTPEELIKRRASLDEKNAKRRLVRRKSAGWKVGGKSKEAQERAKEAQARWYRENKEKVRLQKASYYPVALARMKERLRTDPEYAIIKRLRCRMLKAVRAHGAVRAKNSM